MNNSWYVKQIDNKVKISIPFEIQRGLIEGDLEPGFYGEEYKYFSNCLDDNSYEFQLFFRVLLLERVDVVKSVYCGICL